MCNKKWLVVCIAASISPIVLANQAVQLAPIVVSANRVAQSIDSVAASITVLEGDDITQSGASDIIDLLATQVGVSITRSGGKGQSSSVFIRGAASNQNIVLLNGIRLNDASTGGAQLGALPLELIERIEIIRGARASVYGADAIGGIINIVTRPSEKESSSALLAGVGSDDRRFAGAQVNRALSNTQFYANAYIDKSDGYDFFPNMAPKHDYGYKHTTLSAGMLHSLNDHWQMSVDLLLNNGDIDYQSGGVATSESQKQLAEVGVGYQRNNFDVWLRTNYMKDERETFSSGALSSRTTTERLNANVFSTWQMNADLRLLGGVEWKQDDVSESLTAYDESKRDNRAAHIALQLTQPSYSSEVSLRYDDNEAYGSNTAYNIGVNWQLSPAWQVMFAHGTAFRAPTFNELYYPGGGNPRLEAEESTSYELGLSTSQGLWGGQVNLYQNDVDNLIAGWPAQNVNNARLQGIELMLDFVTGAFEHELGLEFTDHEDRDSGLELPRRAKRFYTWNTRWYKNNWDLSAQWLYQGRSFNDTSNTAQIDSFDVVNLSATYQLSAAWRVSGKLLNVFDQDYATTLDFSGEPYQAQGRNFELSTRYQF